MDTRKAEATKPDPAVQRASLEDPLYYLENLQTVIQWVLRHHSDLLHSEEQDQLNQLLTLPVASQALLARLTMRKGEHFRLDSLNYPEIPGLAQATAELERTGWIAHSPDLGAQDVFRLCRRDELIALLKENSIECRKSTRKAELLDTLIDLEQDLGLCPLQQWWPNSDIETIALVNSALLQRVQLMFFGNLYQDWSEFVLAELGYQKYEPVAFTPRSRGFQTREEIDQYLQLHHAHDALANGHLLDDIYMRTQKPLSNSWLEHRRQRLLYQVAYQAEREGNNELALSLYSKSMLEEGQVRHFRIRERELRDYQVILNDLDMMLPEIKKPESRLHLERIRHRLRRKLGLESKAIRRPTIPTQSLSLPPSDDRVEYAVLQALTENSNIVGAYGENALFTGLFGLFFWPIIFAPLPGAFFHPFQAGPADLFRPDFGARRQHQIEKQLSLLNSDAYKDEIRKTWQKKRGTTCSLINWQLFTEELLEATLACIPASHLEKVFSHLLSDLRHHRRGMPDLVLFDTNKADYQLVEVKGPGDRLQDHQRLWIEIMLEAGLPIRVIDVQWGGKA